MVSSPRPDGRAKIFVSRQSATLCIEGHYMGQRPYRLGHPLQILKIILCLPNLLKTFQSWEVDAQVERVGSGYGLEYFMLFGYGNFVNNICLWYPYCGEEHLKAAKDGLSSGVWSHSIWATPLLCRLGYCKSETENI